MKDNIIIKKLKGTSERWSRPTNQYDWGKYFATVEVIKKAEATDDLDVLILKLEKMFARDEVDVSQEFACGYDMQVKGIVAALMELQLVEEGRIGPYDKKDKEE